MKRLLPLVAALGALLLDPSAAPAQTPPPPAATDPGTMLLTVILRHDQTKTLAEIQAHVEKTGLWKQLPPEGVTVVDYRVVMGMGHIITLRLPPEKLRTVNLVFERSAWGAYRTEFYPTYDYRAIYEENRRKALESKP